MLNSESHIHPTFFKLNNLQCILMNALISTWPAFQALATNCSSSSDSPRCSVRSGRRGAESRRRLKVERIKRIILWIYGVSRRAVPAPIWVLWKSTVPMMRPATVNTDQHAGFSRWPRGDAFLSMFVSSAEISHLYILTIITKRMKPPISA